MFHSPQAAKRKGQQGSMLVMALFVIIVLAFLGLAMIQITSDSSRSMVYEVYGARALNAANSGANRALNEMFGPGANESCNDITTPVLMPNITSLQGCSVVISCLIPFEVNGYTHFRVTSTASCNAGSFITERSVIVEARIRN